MLNIYVCDHDKGQQIARLCGSIYNSNKQENIVISCRKQFVVLGCNEAPALVVSLSI